MNVQKLKDFHNQIGMNIQILESSNDEKVLKRKNSARGEKKTEDKARGRILVLAHDLIKEVDNGK